MATSMIIRHLQNFWGVVLALLVYRAIKREVKS